MNLFQLPSPVERIELPLFKEKGVEVFVKRDDLIHPDISGNKWRKLKWNIAQAQKRRNQQIITFGGAHSNHIAATAAAGKAFGIKTIGIIRGEEVDLSNPTLWFAAEMGMEIQRVSRSEFRGIDTRDYLESLREVYGNAYVIPQGGANFYGVNGCMEIMSELEESYHRVFVASGTGTTFAGMALGNRQNASLYSIPVLKNGGFIEEDVSRYVSEFLVDEETEADVKAKLTYLLDFHFGGYAKVSTELIDFIRNIHGLTGLKLDPVYTGKAFFALCETAKSLDGIEGEKWLFIHTGGLQGIPAMEERIGEPLFADC